MITHRLLKGLSLLLVLSGLPHTGMAQSKSAPFPLALSASAKATNGVPEAVRSVGARPVEPGVKSLAAKPQMQGVALKIEPPSVPPKKVSVGKRLLWYVPNRFMDFADIFRFRVRVGPGMALGFRITDYGSFYFGRYNSVFAGIPGPRNPHYFRWPAGYENLRGIVLGGVDATDDTPYGPEYGPGEIDLGFHLLIIGAEAGVDPIEIGDFLAGIFMFDFERDDYPRRRGPEPKLSSGVSRSSAVGMFRLEDKPAKFRDFNDRLDYLHTNVQIRVSEPVRTVDEYFMPDEKLREAVPDSRMRLGVYTEIIQGESMSFSFQPDVDIDVAVPNMEKRMHIFVQSGQADDLPGRTPSESDNQRLTVGARQYFKKYDISTDFGVRATWPPRAYARVQWQPKYVVDQWMFRPQQRFFIDTKDKVGSLTSFFVDRWIGEKREYYVGTVTSAKYTTDKEETSWEQSFKIGRMREMLAGQNYAGRFERRDVASGGDIRFGIFGTDDLIETYRLTVGMRRPLYQKWIYWDIEPGIEWLEENDFQTGFRFTAGIDMLFWGPTGK